MTKKTLVTWPNARLPWTTFIQQVIRRQDQTGLFLILLLLTAFFSLISVPFRHFENFMLIAMETATISIVAAGQTVVLLTGGIDLSVGAVVALTGIVAAALMKHGLSSYPAMGIALVLGAGIGLGHGALIAKRQLPPFIVTLGSLSILRGIALVGTNASPIHLLPDDFKWISDARLGVVPMPAILMLLTFWVLGYILRNTKFGRYVYAIGGNEAAARLSGVPVDRYKICVYMLSGFLAALAGVILIARIDGGIYTNGEGFELSSIAAVVMGGTSLNGGLGGVWGTLVGVLIMAVVRNGLVMVGISPLWQSIVIGSITLLAVLIDVERRRARQATPPIQLSPGTANHSYLDDLVNQIGQLTKERLGSPYTRLYLMDRELNRLVECRADRQAPANAGSLAERVSRTGQALVRENLAHEHSTEIDPLHSEIHAAVAVPLTLHGRIIGVFEVQSPIPNSFSPEAVKRLVALSHEVAGPLEDAWLLKCGWLVRQTRDALRHLWDDVHLGQCPLAEWAFAGLEDLPQGAGPAVRGARVRQLLQEAITNLKPQDNRGGPRAARRHDVLHLTYVEERTADDAIKMLNVSRRQYFYDLKDALDTLAYQLVNARQKR